MVSWDEACQNSSFAQAVLLQTFPSIWVGQYKVNVILESEPQLPSVHISILYIIRRTIKEVAQNIGKSIDGRFPFRKRRDFFSDIRPLVCIVPEMQFEPGIRLQAQRRETSVQLTIQPSASPAS